MQQEQVTVTVPGSDGQALSIAVPVNADQARELIARRQDITDQLRQLTSRRRQITEELRPESAPVVRTGLEERLRVIDQQIVQLETDVGAITRQLASAPGELTALAEIAQMRSSQNASDSEEAFFTGAFLTVLGFGVIYVFRRFRARRRGKVAPSAIPSADSARLERLEQGMESIAIEIERVSEGQRFVTKLLADSQGVTRRVPASASPESDRA